MRLVLLGSTDTIIGKTNSRRDFGETWKDKEIECGINEVINKISLYYIRKKEKNIKKWMMELTNENDGMEDDRRMVKNQEIG